MPFYAVRIGKEPGVYASWKECEARIKGVKGARYKKFDTEEEAQEFVDVGPKVKQPEPDSSSASKRKSDAGDSGDAKVAKADDEEEVEGTRVYIDGASFNIGTDPRVGVGIYWGENDSRNTSENGTAEVPGKPTKNRAEIYAALCAVKQAKKENIKSLVLHTDNEQLINSITKWITKWKKNDWKQSSGETVANKDDLEALDNELDDSINVNWVSMRGKRDDPGNKEAEKLADAGARKK